jgi:outer membrane receptor protein involved in Fe transport
MNLRHVLLLGAAAVALTGSAYGQTTTGSVRGYVTDANGAPLAEVLIGARNLASGTQAEATSARNGFYALSGLKPGAYEVTARRIGQAPQIRQLALGVGEVLSVDFRLAPSAVEVTPVTITGTVTETRTSEVATNVTPAQIASLPTSDRNFLSLAGLAPGVRIEGGRINDTRKTFASGALGPNSVNVFIDGASYKNDVTGGGVAGQDASRGNPFPRSAVQDFRIITQNYKAEYQKASSAIISATTRSGGSRWEGNAFFFGQGKAFLALDQFDRARQKTDTLFRKPEYARYQAGVSVGGPIVRDRWFFFGSYEGNYQNRANTVAFNKPYPTGYPAFDSVNVAQYQGQFTSPFRSTLLFGKVSYVPSATQSLDVSVNLRHETDLRDFGGVTSFQSANDFRNDITTVVAKHHYSGRNWLNEVTASFQRYRRNPTATDYGLVGREYFVDAPCCNFIGRIGGAASNQDFTQRRLSLRNDVTYSGLQWAGQHVIKAGANVDFVRYDIIKDNDGNPLFTYLAVDSFAFPQRARLGAGNPDFSTNSHQLGVYFQDDWSPSRRLILNVGIRWDYESDMLNNKYVTPASVRAAFDTVVPAKYFTDGTQRPPFYGAFQPRLGFSYAFDDQGRTTVFGGFGVYYDRSLYDDVAINEKFSLQHPTYNFTFFLNPADSSAGEIRWQNSYLNKAALEALLASGQAGRPEVKLVANDTRPPRSNQWSFGLRRILGNIAVSATYTGVRSYHGFTYICGNTAGATGTGQPPNCFAPPVPATFGNVFISSDAVRTWYDALYLKIDKPYTPASRWGGGFAYTLADAKQIGGDLFSFDFRTPTDYPRYATPTDQRHTVIGNWIADVPLGFQFSGLLTLGSGTPFSTFGASGTQINAGRPATHPVLIFGKWAFRNVDLRLRRDVPAFGRGSVELVAEVFNAFNSQNYGCFNNNRDDPGTFGNPNCVIADPRRLQIGGAYTF